MTTPAQPDPAAELRAAAKLLRERAGTATEPPWRRWHDQEHVPGWDGMCVIGDDAEPDAEECNPVARFYIEDDAAWSLLMHPGVGEPLAEWLDAEAKRWDAAVVAAERVWPSSLDDADDAQDRRKWLDGRINPAALAVARALLGGQS